MLLFIDFYYNIEGVAGTSFISLMIFKIEYIFSYIKMDILIFLLWAMI